MSWGDLVRCYGTAGATAPKETLPAQLAKLGVKPEDVKFVGISHYHGDHTGGARGFPEATLLIGKGDWDAIKESVADRAIARIGEHFPNVPGAIIGRQVLSPLDLERVLGLSGGHALHGEMSPDQLFSQRPVRGFGSYRSPVKGLYLCGAGTHPGGGVSGANGRNCAREIIRDRSSRDRRSMRKSAIARGSSSP